MKLIVGLGNPGEQYEKTRHNLGFEVINRFLKDFASVQDTNWETSAKLKGEFFKFDWQAKDRKGTERVVLLKPHTYMNNSGLSVSLAKDFYKVEADDIWIVHDDIDLQLGTLRIRNGGASGGHKGIDSVMQHLGTEKFWRFRLGIGHPKRQSDPGKHYIKNVEEFVLEPFSSDEKGKVKHLIDHSAKAISSSLEHGLESAMNSFNTH
jgi:PTH1 family peptidyl-tRNA hydrolase